MLETGIIPRLNKLRDQKRSFLEFKKIESELDHLNNMVVAYDFYTYQVNGY